MRVPIRKAGKRAGFQPDPFITADKLKEIKNKLRVLKQELPTAILEVKRLGELGDFSENAAYAMAKSRLRTLYSKIVKLEQQIKMARVIKISKDVKSVQLGSKVTVSVDNKVVTYRILGSLETNPAKGVISYRSPLGAILLGSKVGDKVNLNIGGVNKCYQILKIDY